MWRQTSSLLAYLVILVLTGCLHPLSQETRGEVDTGTSLAQVSLDPPAFIDKQLLLGGVVLSMESDEKGSTLELMEWQVNRWGEPLAAEDSGRRFLVRTEELLDPLLYEPGRLVTLTGIVLGEEKRSAGQFEGTYPLFHLEEIHLWDTPFRYGVHPTRRDEMAPTYVGPEDYGREHPYDPGYYSYPYTPYWYRSSP